MRLTYCMFDSTTPPSTGRPLSLAGWRQFRGLLESISIAHRRIGIASGNGQTLHPIKLALRSRDRNWRHNASWRVIGHLLLATDGPERSSLEHCCADFVTYFIAAVSSTLITALSATSGLCYCLSSLWLTAASHRHRLHHVICDVILFYPRCLLVPFSLYVIHLEISIVFTGLKSYLFEQLWQHSLWRFCHSGAIYKYHDLFAYLLN